MQLRPAGIDSNTGANGTAVQLIKRFVHNATSGRARVLFPMVSWNFSLTESFRPHCGTGVDSACNINDYQEYFLLIKEAGV